MKGRPPTFAIILLLSVVFIASVLAGLAMLGPGEKQKQEAQAEEKGKAEYEKVKAEVDAHIAAGRLGAALKAYMKFPQDLTGTAFGKRAIQEARELGARIATQFDKDMTELRVLREALKHERALRKCEEIEHYAIDHYLKQALAIKEELLRHFDTQARDAYLAFDAEFRTLMQKRRHRDAALKILQLIDHAKVERDFLTVKTADYDRLKSFIAGGNWLGVVHMLQPLLQKYEWASELHTAQIILFDVLTAAYAATLIEDAQRGAAFAADQGRRWKLRHIGKEGIFRKAADQSVVFVTDDGAHLPLDMDKLAEIEIAGLAHRGEDPDEQKALAAAHDNGQLKLKVGVFFMYSSNDELIAEAETLHFPRARELKVTLARLYLDVLTSWKKPK